MQKYHSGLAVAIAFFLFTVSLDAFYDGIDTIVQLNEKSFEDIVIASDSPWLINFYAPWSGHCNKLRPGWEDVSKALRGIVNIGAVDGDAEKSLSGQYSVKGFPTIKLLLPGRNGKQTLDYEGPRTAQDIIEWVTKQLQTEALLRIGIKSRGKGQKTAQQGGSGTCGGAGNARGYQQRPDAGAQGGCGTGGQPGAPGGGAFGEFYGRSEVMELTDANFHEEVVYSDDLWMVEFFAPWCGHCKNLKPAWMELAKELKGHKGIHIGAVDCTGNAATCQEFGVQGYPTIKLFGANMESPVDYNGARDSGSMAAFVLRELSSQQPPPEAQELIDQDTFEIHCLGHSNMPPKKLCLIAFLPHILDDKAAGRRAHIRMLTDLAAKYKERPFSYLWAEGSAQPALEAALEVGGYGYPALVAFNPADAKFAHLKSAFEPQMLVQFVEGLRQGFAQVQPLQGDLPDVVSKVPWDGGEGVLEEAEEFSLEDIMADDEL